MQLLVNVFVPCPEEFNAIVSVVLPYVKCIVPPASPLNVTIFDCTDVPLSKLAVGFCAFGFGVVSLLLVVAVFPALSCTVSVTVYVVPGT